MEKRILGVIGGLGPLATARFLELTAHMTQTKREQDNVDMIVYNFPSIPDRTGYILGSNLRSPLPGLLSAAQALARQKVTCIAIPCVTAHYFHGELQAAVPVPVLNGVEQTARLLRERGCKTAGILATDGTIRSRLLARELERAGITPIVPSQSGQADVMHLIYENIKAGKPPEMERFRRVHQELLDQGAEVSILGCTELSLLRRDRNIGPGFVDVMEVLARECILRCGKKVRPEWEIWDKEEGHNEKYSGVSGTHGPAGTRQNRIRFRKRLPDIPAAVR